MFTVDTPVAGARKRESKDRNHGIARARYVEHLLRVRRDVGNLVAVDNGKSFLRSREDEVANAEFAHDVTRRFFHVKVLVRNGFEEHLVDFLQIWRDVVGILIFRPLRPLRIDDDGNAVIVCGTDDMLRRKFGARAFAVVRDDHAVHALVQLAVDIGKVLLHVVAVHCAGILEIKAQHLLMSADDANLRRRRAVRPDKPCVVDAARGEFLEQRPAVHIVADKARDADVRAEKRDVVRHVCRAAERLASPRHMRDRHGRLGRDARDLAGIIFIQHDIADNENVAAHALFRNDSTNFGHVHETAPISTDSGVRPIIVYCTETFAGLQASRNVQPPTKCRYPNFFAQYPNFFAQYPNFFAQHTNFFAQHTNFFAQYPNFFAQHPNFWTLTSCVDSTQTALCASFQSNPFSSILTLRSERLHRI